MQRVSRSTAVLVMPSPPSGGSPGFFAAPNPSGGVPATVPGYEWFNGVQEEIANVIEAAGIALSATDNDQLALAIAALIADALSGLPEADTNVALVNVVNGWLKAQAPVTAALVDGAVINWDCGNVQVATLTIAGNRTVAAPADVEPGALYMLRVTQDGTGSRLLAWNSAFKFGASGAPTLTTTAGKTDFLSFLGGAADTLEFLGARLNGV